MGGERRWDKKSCEAQCGNPLVPADDERDASSRLHHAAGDDDEQHESHGSSVRHELLCRPALVHDAESVEKEDDGERDAANPFPYRMSPPRGA